MINLYLLKYNNYYNRKIKKEAGIGNYSDYILASFQNIYTFDYADGINTSHVLPYKGETPDYAIVTEEDESGNEEITSRWFVVESSYIRGGKYRVSLRRDLIADNLEEVLDAPCMVEKGYINDQLNDDSIFNDEGQSYNQIKKGEILLPDKTGCPWIVGYLAAPTETQKRDKDGNLQWDSDGHPIMESEPDKVVTGSVIHAENEIPITKLSDIKYYDIFDMTSEFSGTCNCRMNNNDLPGCYIAVGARSYNYAFKENVIMGYFSPTGVYGADDKNLYAFGLGGKFNDLNTYWQKNAGKRGYYYSTLDKNVYESVSNTVNVAPTDPPTLDMYNKKSESIINCMWHYYNILDAQYKTYYTLDDLIGYYRDKTYKLGDRLYKVELTFDSNIYSSNPVLEAYSNDILSGYENIYKYTSGPIANTSVSFTYIYKRVNVKIKEIKRVVSTTIPGSSRPVLKDAPYCMFCMPYGDINAYKSADDPIYTTNKEYNIAIANSISTVLGTEKVYDLQIVPYCPITSVPYNNGANLINQLYTPIYLQGTTTEVGFILWCNDSSFSFDIKKTDIKNLEIDDLLKFPFVITNYKEDSQLSLCRLSDPSHTQVFEFNPAKNGGISKFHVQCTYKPNSPYISIHPDFGRLYGKDYDDTRGLICGGDYSLPIVSNAWTEYEYRNKNYQNTFNREIQSMELSNKIQKRADIVNAVANTANAGIQGAIGAKNLLGSLAAVPAGIGGAMDVHYKEMLRNDQVDKTKTLFNYNLQNIQALANTVSKSNPYNIDNKYVPYLEIYTCSDVEREAFKLKMKYDGMTIMRTGTLRYFLNYKDEVEESYIKGAIIRFPNLSEDYDYAKELSNEVGQGFYLDRRWY